MKTLGCMLTMSLALTAACGDDEGSGGAAACKKHNEAAKKCDAEPTCETEREASCLSKHPGAVCDNGEWGEEFEDYLGCLLSSSD